MKFSNRSLEKLSSCHPDLQLIYTEAIKYSPIDFGISHGHRPSLEQFELFKKGRVKLENGTWNIVNRSKIVTHKDGYEKRSKHNHTPSKAVDIFCWPKNIMWDEKHLSAVGCHILATANRLYAEGKISHHARWGSDWDMDGTMTHKDPHETFTDLPHIELK